MGGSPATETGFPALAEAEFPVPLAVPLGTLLSGIMAIQESDRLARSSRPTTIANVKKHIALKVIMF